MRRKISLAIMAGVLFFSTPAVFADDQMCFQKAGNRYNINADLLKSISLVESKMNQQAVNTNNNGTQDVCHMQINTSWKKLFGQEWSYIVNDPCFCTTVGAWVLRQCINQYGQSWEAVACYNTGKAPSDTNSPVKKEAGKNYINRVQKALANLTQSKNRAYQ